MFEIIQSVMAQKTLAVSWWKWRKPIRVHI